MGVKERESRMKGAIFAWAEKEKEDNPSFSLVVGKRSFTVDQIVEHVQKGTEEGDMLLDMVVDAGASLFLNRKF